ncbi:MAG TPA: sigma-70 family RNA polymerase sigma factor [Verrucomicrobiae bacterium]|nr:sigma-70 family RNA polymerase sigma factor [Verrucomicrobiae bacterium]
MLTEPGTDSLLPTRQSLLSRLRDWQDHDGWREFFDTYWRLIYRVARQSGLEDAAAQDVVQTTFIYLARRMPKFRYDPERGSFKSWLRRVTRSRISVFRRRAEAKEPPLPELPLEDDDVPVWESIPDPAGDRADEIWQREWDDNLLKAALRRISAKVSAQQLMIFELAALGEVPLKQVACKLDVSLMQVYLARHRVGKLFKAEVTRLRKETE